MEKICIWENEFMLKYSQHPHNHTHHWMSQSMGYWRLWVMRGQFWCKFQFGSGQILWVLAGEYGVWVISRTYRLWYAIPHLPSWWTARAMAKKGVMGSTLEINLVSGILYRNTLNVVKDTLSKSPWYSTARSSARSRSGTRVVRLWEVIIVWDCQTYSVM